MKNEKLKIKNYFLKFIINKFTLFLLLNWINVKSVLAASKELGNIEPLPGAYNPNLADTSGKSVGEVITKVFSNALAVFTLAAGIMFMIYFILAALSWITSSGKPDKVQEAQNKMINAVIGLIAIVATYTIAFIVGKILGFELLNPAQYIEDFWK